MQKQKKKLPSWEEWHVPGYNFNGAYTENIERMELSYKGNVGTESYFLPVNKLDLGAFKHDLLYFSPSAIARMYADQQYWKNHIKSEASEYAGAGTLTLSNSFIYSAWAMRMTKEATKLGVTVKIAESSLKSMFKSLLTSYKSFWIPTSFDSTDLKFKGFYLAGKLFNTKTGIIEDRHIYNKIAKEWLGTDLRTARGQAFYKSFIPLVNQILGLTFMYGSSYNPKGIIEATKLHKLILGDYIESQEFKKVNEEVEKVTDKYEKYLNSVGRFEKGTFMINDDINEKQAKKLYVDYFKQSRKYFSFINEFYKDFPGYKEYVQATYPDKNKFPLPKLDKSKLDMVANPINRKPPTIVLPPNFEKDIKGKDPINFDDKIITEYLSKIKIVDDKTGESPKMIAPPKVINYKPDDVGEFTYMDISELNKDEIDKVLKDVQPEPLMSFAEELGESTQFRGYNIVTTKMDMF